MSTGSKLAVTAIAGVFLLGLGIFILLPHVGRISSSPKQTMCFNNVNQIAQGLKAYAADHEGKLPPALDALCPTYVDNPRLFHCRFDKRGKDSCSYSYLPEGWEHNSRRIVLACRAEHPDVVISADGDKGPGMVPVIYNDFTFARIPKSEYNPPISSKR